MGARIEVEGFGKDIGRRRIVDDVSFAVEPGRALGFLGRNGAGKTTTIRALLGIVEPTRGRLVMNGEKFSHQAKVRVGYLPEERGLYRKERVLDVMVYLARLGGSTSSDARRSAIEYLERVDLGAYASTRLDRLSGGQQQKIEVGVATLNHPDVLILDEPTKGLDPVNRQLLMTLVDEQCDGGATVILITHHMDEVERLCDDVFFLADGRGIEGGEVGDVRRAHGGRTLDQIFVDLCEASSSDRVKAR